MSQLADFGSKQRACSFNEKELVLFRSLVDKYSAIIFNKRTDCTSSSQKEQGWASLTCEFNALGSGTAHRTAKQLKLKLTNMRRATAKEFSNEKKGRQATGGGPPPSRPTESAEWLHALMSLSFSGLPAVYDSDAGNEGIPTPEIGVVEGAAPMEQVAGEKRPSMSVTEHVMDSTTLHALLRTPISSALRFKKKERCTPPQTRKVLCEVSSAKLALYLQRAEQEKMAWLLTKQKHDLEMLHMQEGHDLEMLHMQERRDSSKQMHDQEMLHMQERHDLSQRLLESRSILVTSPNDMVQRQT